METVFYSLSKSDFQDLIAETVNACIIRNFPNRSIPPQSNSPEFITRQEAADILHITLPTLLSRTLEGKITGYRNGRRVLYKKSEVEAAMTEIPANQKRRV